MCVMGAIFRLYCLREAVRGQSGLCGAIIAAKNSASIFNATVTCSSVALLAWRHTSSDWRMRPKSKYADSIFCVRKPETREEKIMSATLINLIIQLIAGAIGGNAAGAGLKNLDL